MDKDITQQNEYETWTDFIARKIQHAQTNAVLKVNTELLMLYWEIGNSIIEKQKQNGWGSKVIELLADDLSKSFPRNSGFSVRNLKYMRAFAEAYALFLILQVALAQSQNQFVQVPLAQITWYHHISRQVSFYPNMFLNLIFISALLTIN